MKRASVLLVSLILLFLFSGCADKINTQASNLSAKKVYKVIPFANYTQTPLAGYRVGSIAEGVLRSKGLELNGGLWDYKERDYSNKEIKEILASTKGVDYLVTGYVNEFRYKTGIDGEPAVSITLLVYNVKQRSFVWRGVLSKSGWSYESVGVLAQESLEALANEMLKIN